MNIEKIESQIAIGETILKELSIVHPNKIQTALETIVETYMDKLPQHVQDEYSKYLTFKIIYKKDKTLDGAYLTFGSWDTAEITLNIIGIKIVYAPEHGSSSEIVDLPWNIIKSYFNGLILEK